MTSFNVSISSIFIVAVSALIVSVLLLEYLLPVNAEAKEQNIQTMNLCLDNGTCQTTTTTCVNNEPCHTSIDNSTTNSP